MKKKYILGSAASAIIIGLCGYELGRFQNTQESQSNKDNSIKYIDNKTTKKSKVKKNEDLTPDQVSAKEGITAEQIVVKITDQGYVTSHGDHYHYYNGKVPFDAIISEDLVMKDPNYVLNQEDIVNDVKDGYIIKVNGQYYLYLKNPGHTTNVRTREQIAKEREKGTQQATKEWRPGCLGRHDHILYNKFWAGEENCMDSPFTTRDTTWLCFSFEMGLVRMTV